MLVLIIINFNYTCNNRKGTELFKDIKDGLIKIKSMIDLSRRQCEIVINHRIQSK